MRGRGVEDGVRFPGEASVRGSGDGIVGPVPETRGSLVHADGLIVPLAFGITVDSQDLDKTTIDGGRCEGRSDLGQYAAHFSSPGARLLPLASQACTISSTE